MCTAFSATLKGSTRSWFRKLSPGTIDSFSDLSRLFVANFMSCRVRQKNASHLFTVHQKEGKSLKDYIKRFNQAVVEVEDPSVKVVIMEMMKGLAQAHCLIYSLKMFQKPSRHSRAKPKSILPQKSWPRPSAEGEGEIITRERSPIVGELTTGTR